MNKSAEHHAAKSRTARRAMEQDLVPELKAKLKAIRKRKKKANQTPIGSASRTKQALDFLRAHKLSQNGSSECMKPRTLAQLESHAYAWEVAMIESAICCIESLSQYKKAMGRTIPFTAGMAMDDALLALYKAKGAFDCFQNEER